MRANAKNDFRPTLETLENREMMDAGIGGAVMHPMMPDIAQGAQVRLLAQEPSALQNQNNPPPQALAPLIVTPSYISGIGFSIGEIIKFKIAKESGPLSQALTQANQAFVAQSQQLSANVQAVDHIFSAWSQHVDQVVKNIPGLQASANDQAHKDNPTATLVQNIPGLQASANFDPDQDRADKYGRWIAVGFDALHVYYGGWGNLWGITRSKFLSAKCLQKGSERYQVDIDLERWSFGGPYHSTLSIQFSGEVTGPGDRRLLTTVGTEVTTNGKPDASLFLLQGLLLLERTNY
jgi:hypothetical protein